MSFRLKAATVAAFALTAIAATMASDASFAIAAAGTNETIPDTIRTPRDVPAVQDSQAHQVGFAAAREIVQPLTPANAPAGDSSEKAASLAALVEDHGAPEELAGDMQCLAGAVYFEAKGESLAGQLAVARVIINRMASGRFANSLCGVVYQPGQFSFVHGNSMPAIATTGRAWREAVAIAQIAMDDSWNSQAEGALYFHARRVSPRWARARMASIDNHIFYR